MNFLKVFKGAFIVAAAVSLSSCLKNKGQDYVEPDVSYLNIYHASPGSPVFDFIMDGQRAVAGFEYKEKAGYYTLYAGARSIAFYKQNPTSAADTIRTFKLTAKKDSVYSLFLIGPKESPQTLLVNDHLTAPATGKANVRFLNLSPDAGDFILKATTTTVDTTLFSDISYKEATAFSAITPRTYKLELYKGSTKVTELDNTTITAGKNYTIWAVGLESASDNALKPTLAINEN